MSYLDAITARLMTSVKASSANSEVPADGEAFAETLRRAMQDDSPLDSVLEAAKLPLQNARKSLSSVFKNGWSSAGQVGQAMNLAQAGLPGAFKNQLGLGLVALGQEGLGANSMAAGAALLGVRSPAEALKEILGALGGEMPLLKLDKDALPQLGQILADSGLEDERIQEVFDQLAGGDLSLDQVFRAVSQAAEGLDRNQSGGLIATEDGLTSMGQFFMSLGLSPEVAKSVTQNFKPGDQITASALREIIAGAGDNTLAPGLAEADVTSLQSMLESMGAGRSDFKALWDQLSHTKGQLSLEGFLKFVDGVEAGAHNTLTEAQLNDIKNLMDSVTKENQVVRDLSFNEAMVKLSLLGDRELDDNFRELSPALQALRGGVSALKADAAAGQGGNFGQGGGQGGHQEQNREKYRQALNSQINTHNTQVGPAAAADLAGDLQSYGGQETLARQISQKMLYSVRRGVHRLKMDLNPADLGRLNIELKVEGEKLTAHITAESRETYEALTDEVENLKEALAAGGLEIGRMTLSFDNRNSGRREFADLGLTAESSRVREAAEVPPEIAAARMTNPEALVDRLV